MRKLFLESVLLLKLCVLIGSHAFALQCENVFPKLNFASDPFLTARHICQLIALAYQDRCRSLIHESLSKTDQNDYEVCKGIRTGLNIEDSKFCENGNDLSMGGTNYCRVFFAARKHVCQSFLGQFNDFNLASICQVSEYAFDKRDCNELEDHDLPNVKNSPSLWDSKWRSQVIGTCWGVQLGIAGISDDQKVASDDHEVVNHVQGSDFESQVENDLFPVLSFLKSRKNENGKLPTFESSLIVSNLKDYTKNREDLKESLVEFVKDHFSLHAQALQNQVLSDRPINAQAMSDQEIELVPLLNGMSGDQIFLAKVEKLGPFGVVKVFHDSTQFNEEVVANETLKSLRLLHSSNVKILGLGKISGSDHKVYPVVLESIALGESIDTLISEVALSSGAQRVSKLNALKLSVRRVAVALGEMHSRSVKKDQNDTRKRRNIDSLLDISRTIEGFSKEYPTLFHEWSLEKLQELTKKIISDFTNAKASHSMIHGDAHPGNIFYDEVSDTLTFIDNMTFSRSIGKGDIPLAHSSQDVATFLTRMRRNALFQGLSDIEQRELEQAFMDHYRGSEKQILFDETFPFYWWRMTFGSILADLKKIKILDSQSSEKAKYERVIKKRIKDINHFAEIYLPEGHLQERYLNAEKPFTLISSGNIERWRKKVNEVCTLVSTSRGTGLAPRCWTEYLDPKHRPWHYLNTKLEEWKLSDSDHNFLEWVDRLHDVESHGSANNVLYDFNNKDKYKLVIQDGKFYQGGALFDTTQFIGKSRDPSPGYGLFVVEPGTNSIYSAQYEQYKIHHSTPLSGKRTVCSGMIKVEKGELKSLFLLSGHYTPNVMELKRFLALLPREMVSQLEIITPYTDKEVVKKLVEERLKESISKSNLE